MQHLPDNCYFIIDMFSIFSNIFIGWIVTAYW